MAFDVTCVCSYENRVLGPAFSLDGLDLTGTMLICSLAGSVWDSDVDMLLCSLLEILS